MHHRFTFFQHGRGDFANHQRLYFLPDSPHQRDKGTVGAQIQFVRPRRGRRRFAFEMLDCLGLESDLRGPGRFGMFLGIIFADRRPGKRFVSVQSIYETTK